jgi:hypothetical protein
MRDLVISNPKSKPPHFVETQRTTNQPNNEQTDPRMGLA